MNNLHHTQSLIVLVPIEDCIRKLTLLCDDTVKNGFIDTRETIVHTVGSAVYYLNQKEGNSLCVYTPHYSIDETISYLAKMLSQFQEWLDAGTGEDHTEDIISYFGSAVIYLTQYSADHTPTVN